MKFDNLVEAVRAGFIIARDRKAAARWAARKGRQSKGLKGKPLDDQIMMLATRFPDKVKTERVN